MTRFAVCLVCLLGCGSEARLFVAHQIDHGSGGEPIGTGLSVATHVLRGECQWDFGEPICPDKEFVGLSDAFGDGVVADAEPHQGGLVVVGLTPGIGTVDVDGEARGDFEVEVLETKISNILWSADDAAAIGAGVVFVDSEFSVEQRHFPVGASELLTIPPRHWDELELQGRSPLSLDAGATGATLRPEDSGPPRYYVQDDLFVAGPEVGAASIRSQSGAQLNLEIVTEAAIAEIRFLAAGELFPYTTVELDRLELLPFATETVVVAPFAGDGTRIYGCPTPPQVSAQNEDIETVFDQRSSRSCVFRIRRRSSDGGGEVTIAWGEQTATLPLE